MEAQQQIEIDIDDSYKKQNIDYFVASDQRLIKIQPFGGSTVTVSQNSQNVSQFEIQPGFINFSNMYLTFNINQFAGNVGGQLFNTPQTNGSMQVDYVKFNATFQWLFNQIQLYTYNQQLLCQITNLDHFSKLLPLFTKKDKRKQQDLFYFPSCRQLGSLMFAGGTALLNQQSADEIGQTDPFINQKQIHNFSYQTAPGINNTFVQGLNNTNNMNINNMQNNLLIKIAYDQNTNSFSVRLRDICPQSIFSVDQWLYTSRSLFLKIYFNNLSSTQYCDVQGSIGNLLPGTIGIIAYAGGNPYTAGNILNNTVALQFNVNNFTLNYFIENNSIVQDKLKAQQNDQQIIIYNQIICNSISQQSNSPNLSLRIVSPYGQNSKLHSCAILLLQPDTLISPGNADSLYYKQSWQQNTSALVPQTAATTSTPLRLVQNLKVYINSQPVQPFIDYNAYDNLRFIDQFDHGYTSTREVEENLNGIAFLYGERPNKNNIIKQQLDGLDFNMNGEIVMQYQFNLNNALTFANGVQQNAITFLHYSWVKTQLFLKDGIISLSPLNIN